MRRACLLALPFVLLTAACGGGSPASPSMSGSSSGATISGSFVSATSGSPARVGRTTAVNATNGEGLSVSVVGTTLSALVRGGQFSLPGVPAGPLSLRFSGDGVDSGLDLAPVQSTEDIDIEVGLDGSSIVLESERRSFGAEVQLEGRVESMPPTTAGGSFIVAGQLVTTTLDTRYFGKGTSFTDLAIGIRVHVKGQPDATSLVASAIDIQNTRADLPVNINGVIEAFSGDATAFQLTIGGRLVRGDAGTELYGGTVFTDIAVGAFGAVKGVQEDGIVYASRLHIEADEEEEANASASIEGQLMSIGGSGDALTLVVGETTAMTTGATLVRRRGNTQPLSTLAVGMTLHVVGTRQPDLSLMAKMIQIKGDAEGGAFETTGSMGGVKGTCPALSFSVNGYLVATDVGTAFTPDCSTFKSGTKALVQGAVQADGAVTATAVTKP